MAAQVHDPAAPASPGSPAGRRPRVVELGQPAHDPPEAVAPVERPVDEDDGGRARVPGPAAT